MRLIKTTALQLEEFFHGNIPRYAILSHTWGNEEVTFHEMRVSAHADLAKKRGFEKISQFYDQSLRMRVSAHADLAKKKGFEKISQFCDQSLRIGIGYAWVDTCCINNSSSAELSEAINSMYRWYQNAEVCFAYLVDVHTTQSDVSFERNFSRARWFTRGWCLQELIAPRQLFFFNSTWEKIGSKSTLQPIITQITGIDRRSLLNPDLSSISVARRMSWASKRQTTRPEDIAYCLLGIFDVNIPLLYGEGEKAFIRLQEEIMKEVDDHSIFAWRFKERSTKFSMVGVLAKHPSYFLHSADIQPHPTQWGPYSMTNKGIQIQLPLFQTRQSQEYLAVLGCHEENDFKDSVGLLLRELIKDDNQYVRYDQDTMVITAKQAAEAKLQTIFLSKRDKVEEVERPIEKCWIRTHPGTSILGPTMCLTTALPTIAWNLIHGTMNIREGWSREETVLVYTNQDAGQAFAIALQLFPIDCFATVSLHPLEAYMTAEDESVLKQILEESQSTAISTTARLEAVSSVISAAISVEDIRGQRVFVLDVDMEQQDDPSESPASYSSAVEYAGHETLSLVGVQELRSAEYPIRLRQIPDLART